MRGTKPGERARWSMPRAPDRFGRRARSGAETARSIGRVSVRAWSGGAGMHGAERAPMKLRGHRYAGAAVALIALGGGAWMSCSPQGATESVDPPGGGETAPSEGELKFLGNDPVVADA